MTLTVITGEAIGTQVTPAPDITWDDLGSSPFGSWDNWTDWRIATGTSIEVQIDDDLGSIDYRTPELNFEYQGDATVTLKISDTGTFTGEETTVTLTFETPVAFVAGRYYRWGITITTNSEVTVPMLYGYFTRYTDDLVVETLEDVDVFASYTTSLSTNLGLVRNIQATALQGDPYVVDDYIISTQTGDYLRTPRTLTDQGVTIDLTDGIGGGVIGSFLYDGVNDSLAVDMGNLIDHAGNNFTYEMWVKVDSAKIGTNTTMRLMTTQLDSAAGGLFNINAVTSTAEASNWALDIDIYIDGVQRGFTTLPYTLNPDVWHHIAIVRNGTDLRGYVDGTSYASYTITGAGIVDTLPETVQFGGPDPVLGAPATNYLQGKIDEVRISDTARYTTTFTAPNWRMSNDPDTLLLLHADNTAADDGGQDYGTDAYIITQSGGSPVIKQKNPPQVQVVDYNGNPWDGTIDVVLRGFPKIQFTQGGVVPITI